jgi:1,4-alpha-glucan branching enzyme
MRVRFRLDAPGAKKVLLAGDFTDWEAQARPMRRSKARGSTFATSIALEPGDYQYKFIVDGCWVQDPKADSVPNELGTLNSRVSVPR